MKALIIGGGIGGLTTALALQQRGMEAEVYEAGPALRPQGAGIMLASNAMQIFARLGMAEAISAAGIPLRRLVVSDQQLRPLQELEQETIRRQFGYATHTIGRTELRQVLYDHFKGPVHFGKRLYRWEQDATGVTAFFEDGSEARGALLIGADGIHSRVRQLFPRESSLRYAGQTCWRGIADYRAKEPWGQECWEILGRSGRFGFTPISEDKMYWFAVQKAAPGGQDPETGIREAVLGWLQDFPDPVPAILSATPEDRILRNDIYDLEPIPHWSEGRVALVGDAVHATTPNMGQGGCQAIESAWVVAHYLDTETSAEDAYLLYETTRRTKAMEVVKNSRRIGQLAHWRYGRGLRNWVLRNTPERIARSRMEELFTLEIPG